MSVARSRHRKASTGQRAAPSAAGGFGPAALALLPPPSPSARLYPARTTPAPGNESGTSRRFASQRGGDPFPCAARACAALVARAPGSQCPSSHRWVRLHQALLLPSLFCGFARLDDYVIAPLSTADFFLLGPLHGSERHLMAFFPGFCSSSAFLAPPRAASSPSHLIPAQFSTASTPPNTISSSASSLRISWETGGPAAAGGGVSPLCPAQASPPFGRRARGDSLPGDGHSYALGRPNYHGS